MFSYNYQPTNHIRTMDIRPMDIRTMDNNTTNHINRTIANNRNRYLYSNGFE